VDDAVGVVRWLAAHGDEIGVDTGPLAVVGDSSGANLAAAVSLVLRDDGDSPVAFQALLYPVTDPAMDTESYRENADDPFLSADEMIWYWAQYGEALRRAGVPVSASEYQDMPHGFLLFAGRLSRAQEGLAEVANAIVTGLGTAG
jgi:acetyl esterase